jgi:GNAT superfamily N-acetyltransferase
MSELRFRLATPADYEALRTMIISSFEPITWFKKIDQKIGPLNGVDWLGRWNARLDKVFATQIVLIGETDSGIAAAATGTVESATALGFIDLLAVDQRYQGKGFGREMLRGMLDHFRTLGMKHANLECLTDNDRGNALYASEGWDIVASSNRWFIRLD